MEHGPAAIPSAMAVRLKPTRAGKPSGPEAIDDRYGDP
jgi:hypothetical protein